MPTCVEQQEVHAAEYLLALDYPQGVKEAFLEEEKLHGGEPRYRIGIWRVLARAAYDPVERSLWIDRIRAAAFDEDGEDRTHAVETLAKLGYRLVGGEIAAMERATASENGSLAPFAAWTLANSGKPEGEKRLASFLASPDATLRYVAAYALGHLPKISASTQASLAAAIDAEPADSPARVYLISVAAMHAPKNVEFPFRVELLDAVVNGSGAGAVEACRALARVGGDAELPLLTRLLDSGDADLRAAAANALLRIDRRVPHRLGFLDLAVIALYALGMLSVGWYYSRRMKTQEQYLLGDRKMRPLMVGLSLFAALISSLSYLAYPGEIIKYGPMIISMVLGYPLVALVVGWWIIPYIMQLKVTSAYEILETRLGGGCRTLGSLLFLSLRLLWMSVIIFASADKVVVPLLGLAPWTTPLVCVIMAAVAIAYTSMGGLKAGVLTDVIQTAILMTAAVVTVITITVSLGGVGAWWPGSWHPHWPEPTYFPKLEYDPNARITMFGTILAIFIWFLCTAVSDQIAVQRYLATRDAKAARSALCISLAADFVVFAILACVGMGLLAFFQASPHLLPDNQTVLGDSDRLFSHFILIGFPVGLSGLVVAGLLSCALSSLSAGINSTCSVIAVDIIDRLRGKGKAGGAADAGRVRQLKLISLLVGLAVVALSLLVNMVPGNLLEICYKVVNLFVAPLAGLFFLALFVPWARGFGALVGAACGLAVVVAINYWQEITGTPGISFLWGMPLSLIVEIGVGALVSLIPIGKRRPMIE
ncbi:MAG: sodium/solute symporter [Pirellulaceae bacterium]|nr:sodium/solute symporter [Pirellulaceae bacterium]